MPTLTVTKTYDTSQVLTEADLDSIKSSLETFFNTTKIDGDNIQTGGVPTAAIANSAVTADKLGSGAVTSAKLDTNIAVAGTLGVTGATTLSSTLAVTGATTLSSTLAVTGAVTTDGSVRVGDATGDTLTIGGTSGSILSTASGATLNGISLTGASHDGVIWPRGTSCAGLHVRSGTTKTVEVRSADGASSYPIVTSPAVASNGANTIIRGTVLSDGTLSLGTGFTSSRTGVGLYTVSITNTLSDVPSVAASPSGGSTGVYSIRVYNQAATGFQVVIRDAAGTATDVDFGFIAMGSR